MLLIASLSYVYVAISKASSFESPTWDIIKTNSERAFASSRGETIGTLCGVLAAVIFLGIWKSRSIEEWVAKQSAKWKKTWAVVGAIAKWSGIMCVLGVLLFNWWRGLPGWKFDWDMAWQLIPLAIFGVFTVITCVVLLLETIGAVDSVSGLDDDIRDGWSSEANRSDLEWFGEQIVGLKARGIDRVSILCGDIHTAGISLLKFGPAEKAHSTYQITSSPMSYVTMPDMVEKLTSGAEEFCILGENGTAICTASNIFYRSKRNFAVIKGSSESTRVDFHFEDLERPVTVLL